MTLTIAVFGFCVASLTSQSFAQSLLAATARYPQLSDFTELITNYPRAAADLLTNLTSRDQKQTILIPSNDAFGQYRLQSGASISSLSSSDVGNILNYHTLQGSLSSSDLQRPGGLVSNTALRNESYADREVVENGGARLSQVVYISSTGSGLSTIITARQANALSSTDVRSGQGNVVKLDPRPGNWSGGTFYVVDGFLTLPVNQTDTMTARGLTSMVRGLSRTNVTEGTNAAQGLTCVCPSNEAFADFGNLADVTGNLTDGPASLLATLTRHGLTGSYYTTNFTDGDLIKSQNGYPILVTRRNGSIFLNDARLIGTNFIARTGAVHALDRVMGYLNTSTNITTPANASVYGNISNIPNPTPLSTAAATASKVSGSVTPTATTVGNQGLSSSTANVEGPSTSETIATALPTRTSEALSITSHYILSACWSVVVILGVLSI